MIPSALSAHLNDAATEVRVTCNRFQRLLTVSNSVQAPLHGRGAFRSNMFIDNRWIVEGVTLGDDSKESNGYVRKARLTFASAQATATLEYFHPIN